MTAKSPENTVDFAYLESFTAGDRVVISEVLALFRAQAALWIGNLDSGNPDWLDVVHTIKGAARGIGANGLGVLCARAEAEGAGALPEVKAGLAAVIADIETYQAPA